MWDAWAAHKVAKQMTKVLEAVGSGILVHTLASMSLVLVPNLTAGLVRTVVPACKAQQHLFSKILQAAALM